MGKQEKTSGKLHKLMEGAYLFSSPQGNILFGCPPEILKRILAMHLPMPDTVVVGENLHHNHSSQASLEFPLYHFLFVQRGMDRNRKFQVVANKTQCKGLEELLRVTVVGPTEKEMASWGMPEELAGEVYQETVYLALKNPKTGNPFTIKEMIDFFPVPKGESAVLYPMRGKLAEIRLERTGAETFRVMYGEEAYDIDISVKGEQVPNYKINHKPMERSDDQFKVTVLGRSNGFDPADPANGYLLNMGGRLVMWDCPAYMHWHLDQLKVDPSEIEGIILSHVHEDHIDTSESIRALPFDLYTTPEIYYSLLVKIATVFGCSMEEAKERYHFHEIDINKPMEIGGAKFDFFHSVHAIPALGCRVEKTINGKKGLLHISGDHIAQEVLHAMINENGISQRRYDLFQNLLTGDETLILMDAGGGAIHGNYRDYLDHKGRVAFMHTGLIQEKLPKDKELVFSGEVLDILPP